MGARSVRGWLLWMAIASNLGLAGFLVTRAVGMRHLEPRPALEYEGQPLMEFLALEALSDTERARARAEISGRLPELRAAGDLAEQAYVRFAATFEADPFDPEAARRAAAALREARETQWTIAAQIYIDTYATLPQSARQEMLAARGRGLQHSTAQEPGNR